MTSIISKWDENIKINGRPMACCDWSYFLICIDFSIITRSYLIIIIEILVYDEEMVQQS